MNRKEFPLFRLGCVITILGVISMCQFVIPGIYKPMLGPFENPFHDPMSVDIKAFRGFYSFYNKTIRNITTIDPNTCPNASTSTFKLLSQKNEFQLGDTILVAIQLFDSYKHRKTTGGDFLRVWMKEDGKEARAAGVIIDHNNGSYTGSLKALWTGSPQVYVGIADCREIMDVFYRVFRDHYTVLNYFMALFESDGVREITACLPVPHIPSYTHVCNLTSDNYGLPWYCGKPKHRKLLCHDFAGIRQHGGQMSLFTPHEARFLDSWRLHQNIPDPLEIRVISNKETVPLPTIPCNKSPLRQSWEASTPVGFFYKNQWISLTCNNTVPTDPQTYRKCLQHRRLWFHGDSTSRQWFVNLKIRLGMELVTEAWNNDDKWHKPAVLYKRSWNTTIILIFHEYPFYHGNVFTKLAYNRATHTYLDELPSDSTDIFVFHFNLHFQPSPPEVFRTHIRRLAKAVRSVVLRAPRVKIALRGPHAFKGGKGAVGFLDDIWMDVFDKIIREEFRGLEDKVLFLNNMDITIATENFDAHPNDLSVGALLEHFMGYVCGS